MQISSENRLRNLTETAALEREDGKELDRKEPPQTGRSPSHLHDFNFQESFHDLDEQDTFSSQIQARMDSTSLIQISYQQLQQTVHSSIDRTYT